MIPDTGAYLLFLGLDRAADLEVGALGSMRLPRGGYIYCGSGQRGLHARVLRHLCRCRQGPRGLHAKVAAAMGAPGRPPRPKRLRWHVDHLLERSEARVLGVSLLPGGPAECALALGLQRSVGAAAAHAGFGASDCTSGCGAHLLRLARRQHPAARRLASGICPGAVHLKQGRGDANLISS